MSDVLVYEMGCNEIADFRNGGVQNEQELNEKARKIK